MGPLDVPPPKKQRFLAREHLGTHVPTNPVIRVVADDRRDVEQKPELVHVQGQSLGREQPRGDQQRVAREQEPEKQPGFHEDDRSQSDISGPLDERRQVSKATDQVRQEFHCVEE
jgi:hypothetical protein